MSTIFTYVKIFKLVLCILLNDTLYTNKVSVVRSIFIYTNIEIQRQRILSLLSVDKMDKHSV